MTVGLGTYAYFWQWHRTSDQPLTLTGMVDRGLSQIIEHWLPWQGDSTTTIQTENAWNHHALAYLRSKRA